jgi:hypothetical protein
MAAVRLTPRQRKALESLAASGLNGSTVNGMVASGFKVPTLRRLVRDGLAVVMPRRVKAGAKTIEVERIHITAAGRDAIG